VSVNQAKPSDRSDFSASLANKPYTLGLERIGLISLRFPLLIGLAAVVLLIAAAFGIARIKVDDSLGQLFRSDTPEFKTFEEVTRRFPSNEFDVLIVVEGKSLLERSSIEKLRDLVTDLQLIDVRKGHHLDIFGPPAATGQRAAGAAFFGHTARRGRVSETDPARDEQRDHSRQAIVGGWRADADRPRA
jgi:hypothetical protein